MIPDVVIHIANEQPLMADLVAAPAASDACLICRNLRTMNGKKPVFIDQVGSTFLIPLGHVRFVEIPRASSAAIEAERPLPADSAGESSAGEASEAVLSLARIGGAEEESPYAAAIGEPDVPTAGGGDPEGVPDGLDLDLLRRIREA
jgi:hypothetical protein